MFWASREGSVVFRQFTLRRFFLRFRDGDRGVSLVEVVMAVAIGGFLFVSLILLFLRTGFIKWYNENVLTASTLAEDVIEHIRRKSIDDFEGLANFINEKVDSEDAFELYFSSQDFKDQFYPSESLPAALDRLPGAKSLSYVRFDVTRGSSDIEKLSVKVVIRWKETGRWTRKEDKTLEHSQKREYVLTTTIAKSGLRVFLK